MIGLQALATYAAAAFDRNVNLQVTAQAAGSPTTAPFSVTANNFDLLQQSSVLAAGQNVTVTVSGSGSALVQLATSYNVFTDPNPASFAVTTNVTAVSSTLWNVQTCVSRLPTAPAAAASGAMVMVEVGVFSGWQPVQSSLDSLQANSGGLIRLIEQDGQTVSLYLSQLPQLQTCMGFDITQVYFVTGLADASAVAYRCAVCAAAPHEARSQQQAFFPVSPAFVRSLNFFPGSLCVMFLSRSYYNPDEQGSTKIPALRAAALPPAGAPVPPPSDRPGSVVTVGGGPVAPAPVSTSLSTQKSGSIAPLLVWLSKATMVSDDNSQSLVSDVSLPLGLPLALCSRRGPCRRRLLCTATRRTRAAARLASA